MVDRGELQAWKTPGGHRRILRSSLDAWLTARGSAAPAAAPAPLVPGSGERPVT
ncbi:helix-turn-helix domain-containing protein, partial [Roseateles sp. DXS20W]